MPEAAPRTDAVEDVQAPEEDPILTITDEAAERLAEQMDQQDEVQALRLLAQGGCCGMQYAMAMADREPSDDERAVEANGITIYLDEETLELVQGSTVGWTDGVFGAGFTFENPNVEAEGGSCGCR